MSSITSSKRESDGSIVQILILCFLYPFFAGIQRKESEDLMGTPLVYSDNADT